MSDPVCEVMGFNVGNWLETGSGQGHGAFCATCASRLSNRVVGCRSGGKKCGLKSLMAMVVKRGRQMTDCVCRLKEKGENNEVLVVPLITA